MTELQAIIMERDGLTQQEAEEQIKQCKEDFLERIQNGEMPHDILEEHFGLEPDYLFDLI